MKLKLSDFGFASKLDRKTAKMNSHIDTQPYLSPEITERKTNDDKKVDILHLV